MARILTLLLTLAAIIAVTALGPAEKTLGVNARVVYLHGAWVWTALVGFGMAALAGMLGLALNRETLHRWSLAFGRAGLLFWLTYLPISMWAMQTNWNGLFLAEPRWRVAVIFALGGVVLQLGLALVGQPALASAANTIYLIALLLALRAAENVMHPPAPLLESDFSRIQLFFAALLILTLLAGAQVAYGLYRLHLRLAAPQKSLS